jgi:hypothetical protein
MQGFDFLEELIYKHNTKDDEQGQDGKNISALVIAPENIEGKNRNC